MSDTTIRKRRKVTAAEAAKRLGVSVRTIYNYQSEPREVYEKRAEERREMAFKLRIQGKSWKQVGEALGCSAEAARALSTRFANQFPREEEEEAEKLDNYCLF